MLVLALTLAGFLLARSSAGHDARRDSEHRAEVAAAQIRGRIAQAASLTESLRRFMLDAGGTGITSDQFANNALRWLSPARFPAAAWVEQVPDSRRAAYERRIGQPIVTPDERRATVPPGSRPSYLPATLVSGFHPMAVPGTDLGGEPGMEAAIARAARVDGVAATGMEPAPNDGLFLVAPAPNLVDDVLHPGYVVLFVSAMTLGAAATDAPAARITTDGAPAGPDTVTATFTAAGRRFAVSLPQDPADGAGAALPWIVLAAGLVLSALAGALAINRARRSRAQEELDRVFRLSSDVIAVADFNGYFTRVNPAAEQILGYTAQELLSRPYLDFVHPDDREETAAKAAATGQGESLAFENRFVRKDGSVRVLEWTSTPIVEDGSVYAVGRDVTERRQAEAERERLAEEQAALRRVATLVARQAPQGEVISAIAEEIARLFGTEQVRMMRYEDAQTAIMIASIGEIANDLSIGSRWRLGGNNVVSRVFETGRPARIDDYGRIATGPIGDVVRPIGVSSVVATPIIVEGRLWGAMVAGTTQDAPLPPETESRLEQFTELMATAIAKTESHARADQLADEQAALRLVATLVAKERPLAKVFERVAEEVASVFGDVDCALLRDEGDGSAHVVAVWNGDDSAGFSVGARVSLGGGGVANAVLTDGRPARVDDYSIVAAPAAERAEELRIGTAVGCPIVVRGRLWGLMAVAKKEPGAFPPDTEARIARFTDLIATAIANAEARAEVERLADEQAALRRVATLVAEGASPTAVFNAVATEMARLLGAQHVVVCRYEPGDQLVVLAHRGPSAEAVRPGARIEHDGDSVEAVVRRTEQSARLESREAMRGVIAELARAAGVRVAVGAPIVVEGRLWGVVSAGWNGDEAPPSDTELRMAQFAQVLDTAIANADSRDQLTASRARLVTEADQARRRVVRDLHDGAQQRLVHAIVTLKLAQRAFREGSGKAEALVAEALRHAEHGNAELRELAHGILPSVLTHGGLRAGVGAVVSRLDLPVQVDVPAERFPAEVEASAYFIIAEALTNVVKHSHAQRAKVRTSVEDGRLRVEVSDDGIGGANPAGHGLVGIHDRVTALGGRLEIASPPGGGTRVTATLPLSAA